MGSECFAWIRKIDFYTVICFFLFSCIFGSILRFFLKLRPRPSLKTIITPKQTTFGSNLRFSHDFRANPSQKISEMRKRTIYWLYFVLPCPFCVPPSRGVHGAFLSMFYVIFRIKDSQKQEKVQKSYFRPILHPSFDSRPTS